MGVPPVDSRPRPTVRRRTFAVAAPLVATVALLLGLTSCAVPPSLTVRPVITGLDFPWDVTFAPDGTMLVTERGGGITIRRPDGTRRKLNADFTNLFVQGESGLMGIIVDPSFASNRRILTCQAQNLGGSADVRVVPWTVDAGWTTATRGAPIITGMPDVSGRHAGCRLRIGGDGQLWVGTGDAAVGTNPQDLTSLGGKVLRVDVATGLGSPGNPFAGDPNANKARIWSYGHRNVQGITRAPDGTMYTAEQGTDRDDEVNAGVTGNFGYDPVPGYNESVPMTDTAKYPNAVSPIWSSGNPTLATSGLAYLSGDQWKSWNGKLAVAQLKDNTVRIVDPKGANQGAAAPSIPELDHKYGRIRTVQMGIDGNLYVTTSNGGGQDQVLVVIPNP